MYCHIPFVYLSLFNVGCSVLYSGTVIMVTKDFNNNNNNIIILVICTVLSTRD